MSQRYAAGTMVDIYEDPLTMARKEGQAMILAHVADLGNGLSQYKVAFANEPDMVVTRTVIENSSAMWMREKARGYATP